MTITADEAQSLVARMRRLGFVSDTPSNTERLRDMKRLTTRRLRAERRGEGVSQYPPRVRKPKRTKPEKREERRKAGNHCPRCGRKWRKQ